MEACIVLPHQLFESTPLPVKKCPVYLVEEFLFFKQFNFHKIKLAYHRATMKFYQHYLEERGCKINYIDSDNPVSDIRKLIPFLKESGINQLYYIDPVDDWLDRRIAKGCHENGLSVRKSASPMFINSAEELQAWFSNGRGFFQTDFYIDQRKKRKILIDKNLKPLGGKWSFDAENRQRYPKGMIPPKVIAAPSGKYSREAISYVGNNFPGNIGSLENSIFYPTSFDHAKNWLNDFLRYRFADFGVYEDALVCNENFLHHSILTPMLNTGLLTPDFVLKEAMDYGLSNNIPLNSLEGFVRQILGWREFIRGVYILKGREQRTTNFWGFNRKIPPSFYDATTGLAPLDVIIRKTLRTAYSHHIERLMVLGNFMLLCGFDPDEVYRWFMEMYIDAYDWVMVPNVYGMSQFADGGVMATKPYISGSNYLMKMGDFPAGEWQKVWDGLFWNFMDQHRSFFLSNPRLGMLVKSFDKMDPHKRQTHLLNAQRFIDSLG